jgi:arylsulfatase A-like enzyme
VDFNRRIAPGPRECGFDEAFFIPATVDRVPTVFIDGDRVAHLDPSDPLQVSYVQPIGAEPVGHEHPELLKYPADRQHADTIVNGISRIGHLAGGKSARWIDEDIADILTQRATEFIGRQTAGRPFFLCLGTHDPHVPRAPAPRFRGKSAAGLRGDSIVQLDWMVGEVLAALERSGLGEDTIVLFTSDNGPVLFDGYFDGSAEANGDHRSAGPWRGWKYLRYEGGLRVPLIVRWPGRVQPGVSDELVSLLDFFPTLAAAIDRSYPITAGRDGQNLFPALRGDAGARGRDEMVLHGIGNVLALRAGDWKYIPANKDTATGIGRGADPRDQRFEQARVEEDLLFNLTDDPGETKNLAGTFPEKLAELRARLATIAGH